MSRRSAGRIEKIKIRLVTDVADDAGCDTIARCAQRHMRASGEKRHNTTAGMLFNAMDADAHLQLEPLAAAAESAMRQSRYIIED